MASLSTTHSVVLSNQLTDTTDIVHSENHSRHKSLCDSYSSSPFIKLPLNRNKLIQIGAKEDTNKLIQIGAKEETNFRNDIVFNQSFHRIYVFDFDDTIFPTSIIQKNIKIWNHTASNTIDQYKQCHKLYTVIKDCVDYILFIHNTLSIEYGAENIDFVIITNASTDWINDIKNNHSSLIGDELKKLESVVPIISAKDEFEETYDDWYSECAVIAKTDSFIKYIESLDIHHKIPVLYSIGDGKAEYEASQIVLEDIYEDELSILYRICLKTNRKSERKTFKSLDGFYAILQKTKKYLLNTDEELREILEKKGDDEAIGGNMIDIYI